MIGHPERWRSYDGLEIRRDDAYGNFQRSARYDYERRLARIDQPVDRRERWMMPVTANAYASCANNQIVFPAAYLRAPHFDPEADPAVNYGAMVKAPTSASDVRRLADRGHVVQSRLSDSVAEAASGARCGRLQTAPVPGA